MNTNPETSTADLVNRPDRPDRRRALMLFGGAGLSAVLAACSPGSEQGAATTTSAGGASSTNGASTTTDSGSSSTAATVVEDCSPIPEETAGPFPGDGSNGADVLGQDGVVRSDIRSSFGSSTTTAQGVPLTVQLDVVDVSSGCAPLAGAAVYIWHCDREGRYSMYSDGATDENYLRGVQVADDAGRVTFRTIFPAAYDGRWPHIHFEVFPDVASITDAGNKIATSQLAFPEDVCDAVYATDGYEASVSNMRRTSLSSDMVFRDGAEDETPAVAGSVTEGYTATLAVPV